MLHKIYRKNISIQGLTATVGMCNPVTVLLCLICIFCSSWMCSVPHNVHQIVIVGRNESALPIIFYRKMISINISTEHNVAQSPNYIPSIQVMNTYFCVPAIFAPHSGDIHFHSDTSLFYFSSCAELIQVYVLCHIKHSSIMYFK